MKKILSALSVAAFSVLMSNSVNAQVFSVEYLDSASDTIVTNGTPVEVKPKIKIKMDAGIDSMVYQWQVMDYSIPDDWNFVGLCDNITCLDASSPAFQSPYPVQTASLMWNDTAESFLRDKLYVWLEVEPADMIGLAYFKFKVISSDVYPSASQPATAQEEEVLFVVRKDVTVSVNTIVVPQNGIKLYPNPAQDILTIEMADDYGITSASVIDVQGKTIINTNLNNKTLDVQSLNSGMYMVAFYNEDGIKVTTRQFVKH